MSPKQAPTMDNDQTTHSDASIVAKAARTLCDKVWEAVDRGYIDARCPIADAALDLRDAIDPKWNPISKASAHEPETESR